MNERDNPSNPPMPLNSSRRDFLKRAGGAAMMAGTMLGAPGPASSRALNGAARSLRENLIGIQIGAVSFVDEGVEKVLDSLQQRAGVNVLMLAVFTYGRGIAGRQIPGQPLPDHGAQQYDTSSFQGGDYANVHPQYYHRAVFQNFRAPDVGSFDLLGEVIPKAQARGMKSYCWFEDVYNPRYLTNFEQMAAGIDVDGRPARTACLNNPHVKDFVTALVEDWIKQRWVQSVRGGPRPADGYFVSFWRLLVDYPEILAWERLWTDSQREMYALIYGEVKSIRPDLPVGWHIWHNNSFSPFYRAEQDYQKFEGMADFLKVVMYNNCAGPRLAQYIRNVHSTVFGDMPPEKVLEFHYEVLGYKNEASLNALPQAGLSANYVAEETRRALAAVGGRIAIYPGIDIDVPTGPGEKKTSAEDVRQAVRAALGAGAQGVILSRKYSEMELEHLSGAGQALRDLGLWKG